MCDYEILQFLLEADQVGGQPLHSFTDRRASIWLANCVSLPSLTSIQSLRPATSTILVFSVDALRVPITDIRASCLHFLHDRLYTMHKLVMHNHEFEVQ